MKILLVASSANYKKVIPKPPLGIAYISAYLEQKTDRDTKILDMYSRRMTLVSLINEIDSYKPDMICFSATTPQIGFVKNYAEVIKKQYKDIYLVVGGAHCSTVPERTLMEIPDIDIAVIGEGEQTMLELANSLELDSELKEIEGIAYQGNGKIKVNPPRSLIKNLDTIPFPAWDKLDMDLYLSFNYLFGKKVFPIITSRGCTNRCIFCDWKGVWNGKLRFRTSKNIADEIKELNSVYGVNHIIMVDDNLTSSKSRIEAICDEIESCKLKITWECNGRVDKVNGEILQRMRKAGCIYVAYGIESASQDILDYTKKNITLEQVRNAVKLTKDSKMRTGGFFMMGFPPEREEDIKKTVELIKELDLDWVSELSMLVPYPGTEIYKEMKKEELIESEKWDTYYKTDGNPNIKTRYVDNKRLVYLKNKYDKEIATYMRKKIILKHLKEPHKLVSNFLQNPVSFLKSAVRA